MTNPKEVMTDNPYCKDELEAWYIRSMDLIFTKNKNGTEFFCEFLSVEITIKARDIKDWTGIVYLGDL